MGNIRNITHNTFPSQAEDLGSVVDIVLGDDQAEAIVVRSDTESPNRKIYMTLGGMYIEDSELPDFQMPSQGSFKGKKTEVCFNYDTSNTLEGTIVRDDSTEPYKEIIHLDDGRVITTTECQYAPKLDNESEVGVQERENVAITRLKSRLKKLKGYERAHELHDVYKQLVTSRKGKQTNGPYRNLADSAKSKFMIGGPEEIARQIVGQIEAREFAGYVADEMIKFNHLQNHVQMLREAYSNKPMKLDFMPMDTGPSLPSLN